MQRRKETPPISQSDYEDWTGNPVTKNFMAYIEWVKDVYVDDLIHNNGVQTLAAEHPQKAAVQLATGISIINVLEDILDLKYEEMMDRDYENIPQG